ncbi:amidase [Frigoribacterium faeni]|uniref:Amidase n=1 Tax=Frigoribacterium faeni TaxID=145483 RepID=A0A7W3PIB9_9MICO|nr:amidase [Frigoribacterium faeni]MBA8812519.1 amidase [Frigoribacterium faeni]BFF13611.1 amidase [Microbacterium flavescens]GEK81764.1 amidase [Frigoribacterium faeni]
MFELHHLTAHEQWDWLRRGEVSPLELTRHYLDRIERLDGDIGAFVTVTADAARERAAELTAGGSSPAPLWGLPLADKDLGDRAGVATWSGSRLSRGRVAAASSEIVDAVDEAGAVSLGKTATPEYGLTAYTETLIGPPTRNPWRPDTGAGGSSGGAAAAVAAGLLPFAPGSDGGGSIRIPAAATGLVGLKPSRGRVPAQSGLSSLAGLPVGGPIARSVADAALLLDALVSPDGRPPRHHQALWAPPSPDGAYLGTAVRGEGRFQLAVMTTSPWDDAFDVRVDPRLLGVLTDTADMLATMGHGVDETSMPASDYPDLFRTIWQAGAAGIPADTEDELALLEPITRWLVERGREVPARQLGAALTGLAGFERMVVERFAPFDAVLTPTLAMLPRPVGWYDAVDAERNFEQQCLYSPFTSFVNVAGLPAITLPVGEVDGQPVGVQLIGRPGREDVLLAIGAQLERRLRWQRRHPPVW